MNKLYISASTRSSIERYDQSVTLTNQSNRCGSLRTRQAKAQQITMQTGCFGKRQETDERLDSEKDAW